jgi:hypothetical protein
MGRTFQFRDLTEFRRRYWAGEPERRIAKAMRIDRSVIRRLCREHGLPSYDHAGANAYLAAERTLAERYAFTKAANEARRRSGKHLVPRE